MARLIICSHPAMVQKILNIPDSANCKADNNTLINRFTVVDHA